jgi:tetratricopeptide (TPR) repeat protein
MKIFGIRLRGRFPKTTTVAPWEKWSHEASQYWDNRIDKECSKDQKALLAEQLFHYIWQTEGKKAALQHLSVQTPMRQLGLTKVNRGCQLWTENQFHLALIELKTSMEILDSYPITTYNEMEAKVKCHYALGMVHMSMQNHHLAIGEFCQAWRMSVLCSHKMQNFNALSPPSKYMMGKALTKAHGAMEAHNQMVRVEHSIGHEVEGEFCHSVGDLELALKDYEIALRELAAPRENYLLIVQAHIRCKVAAIYETQGNLDQAGDEWGMALTLYETMLGPDHSLTSTTMKRLTENHYNLVVRRHAADDTYSSSP